jgi:putative membrane protein
MLVRQKTESWLGYLIHMRQGSVLSIVRMRLLFFVAFATAVTYAGLELYPGKLSIGTAPFSIVGVALSIYLGFRNNACYDRFWEGRKLWGALVNTSRSITREALTFLDGDEASRAERRALQEKMVHTTIAFVHSLRIHLRDEEDWDTLDLDDEHIELLKPETNRPTAIAFWLGELVTEAYRRGFVDSYHRNTLEQRLVDLTNIQGGCERIKATPIPLSHTALTHRITAVYLTFIPFALLDVVGVYTPIVTLMLGFAFLGLDAVGDEMEDPFGVDTNDLPLEFISTNIERNLLQRLGEEDLPPLPQPDARGVLK